MRIFVAGGSGILGRRATRLLVEAGWRPAVAGALTGWKLIAAQWAA